MARSSPNLIDEQWFLPTEISYMDVIYINLACYQSFTKDLFQVRALSALGKEGYLSLTKESWTLGDMLAYRESHWSTVLLQL